jgi:hypothetical protein
MVRCVDVNRSTIAVQGSSVRVLQSQSTLVFGLPTSFKRTYNLAALPFLACGASLTFHIMYVFQLSSTLLPLPLHVLTHPRAFISIACQQSRCFTPLLMQRIGTLPPQGHLVVSMARTHTGLSSTPFPPLTSLSTTLNVSGWLGTHTCRTMSLPLAS